MEGGGGFGGGGGGGGIMHTKSGEFLWIGGNLSYSRLQEVLLKKNSSFGMDSKLSGMHSVQAGGATAATTAERT